MKSRHRINIFTTLVATYCQPKSDVFPGHLMVALNVFFASGQLFQRVIEISSIEKVSITFQGRE